MGLDQFVKDHPAWAALIGFVCTYLSGFGVQWFFFKKNHELDKAKWERESAAKKEEARVVSENKLKDAYSEWIRLYIKKNQEFFRLHTLQFIDKRNLRAQLSACYSVNPQNPDRIEQLESSIKRLDAEVKELDDKLSAYISDIQIQTNYILMHEKNPARKKRFDDLNERIPELSYEVGNAEASLSKFTAFIGRKLAQANAFSASFDA